MTYLYVTPFFPSPSNWRGAYCLDFVRALKRQRPAVRVEVFVCGNGCDYEIDGVKVWRFEERILPSFILPFLFRKRNERSFLAAVKRSGVDVKDVVVCHASTAYFAIYAFALKGLNPKCWTLLHHHDLASFGLNLGVLHKCSIYNVWLFRRLRALHEQIDCHVFISEASRQSFCVAPDASWSIYDDYKVQMKGPKFFRCRPAKMKNSIILHNGVDTRKFMPLDTRSERKHFVIGCIGNFEVLKDQMTLLRAVDILNHVEHVEHVESGMNIVFVGSGPEREKCERYAREKGIDAEFRSEVKHEQLRNFYYSIDLFVLPSYFEGFGCVFTEAWACGVPFITCEGQGMDDMISEEDRGLWLCKPRNPEDLASKIKYYMKNRPVQRLKGEIDIDKLVQGFVNEVESIRKELISA